jgi:hypothetical protein
MRLHKTIGYSKPSYRPVQDHMWDCYTSRTAATKSCSLLTPASYIRHHSNTPVPHLWLWMQSGHGFLKSIDWINVEFINGNYNKKNITNAPMRHFQATIIINCKISEEWRREDIWQRSWRWPCLRGRTPSIRLSSMSVRLFLFGKVIFSSAGCLTPTLFFGLPC